MFRKLANYSLVLALAIPLHALQAADNTTLTVDLSKPGAKIDRNIFGQFAEHLGHGIYDGIWVGRDSPIPNTRGIRNDVVAALKALKVPNVRWPGGCFADYYHWRKGIGPTRHVTVNTDWGGVTEPNTFGTHEFMDFAGQIGAAAYLSVNVGSGTAQEAAEWLEYMTSAQATTLAQERAANGRAEPWSVPYLGLGNESWDCGGNMSAANYVQQMKTFSRFVQNYNPAEQGDKKMLKIAVGPGGDGKRWTDWTETVMQAYKEMTWSWELHGLSLHNYTVIDWKNKHASVGFGEKEYAEILNKTLDMERLVTTHSAIMDKYDPDKKLMLAVDEWGGWYSPYPKDSDPGFLMQQNSLRDAILAALNINIFVRHADRVRMANIAQMINVLQAMILTDKEKMVLTPTYHLFKLYLPFQDALSVPVSMEAGYYTMAAQKFKLPRLDAVAARDASGKLWIAVTNVDPNQKAELELAINGLKATRVNGETLTAARVDSVNTFDNPSTVIPRKISGTVSNGKVLLSVEPKSVTVVAVE